ncbi:hypothetical protein [Gordonia sp. NPDC003422]
MNNEKTNRDIIDLLGMRTRAAWVVLAVYIGAMFTVAFTAAGEATSIWPVVLAATIMAAAAIIVVRAPGDPLPLWATVLLTLAGPVCCALGLAVTPATSVASILFGWSNGAAVPVLCFMIVRARFIAPWMSLALIAAVRGIWAIAVGEPVVATVATGVTDLAPMTMAVFFALVVRPTALGVYRIREAGAAQVAEISAESAAADERARQIRALGDLARRPLTKIGSGDELTADERVEYELLEAHLRDRLRAPLLSDLGLDNTVYRARVRGVEAVLLDDSSTGVSGGDHGLPGAVASALAAVATEVFDAADDGQVFVRVAPPGRFVRASVLRRCDDGTTTRYEVDHTGATHSYG